MHADTQRRKTKRSMQSSNKNGITPVSIAGLGQTQPFVVGVGAGFMLYVVSKIATDLGSGGIVPPSLAAWLPAIVTLLVGSTVLLHLEDG